jgi:hypothetical protein
MDRVSIDQRILPITSFIKSDGFSLTTALHVIFDSDDGCHWLLHIRSILTNTAKCVGAEIYYESGLISRALTKLGG